MSADHYAAATVALGLVCVTVLLALGAISQDVGVPAITGVLAAGAGHAFGARSGRTDRP
jgi:hypothetical protein